MISDDGGRSEKSIKHGSKIAHIKTEQDKALTSKCSQDEMPLGLRGAPYSRPFRLLFRGQPFPSICKCCIVKGRHRLKPLCFLVDSSLLKTVNGYQPMSNGDCWQFGHGRKHTGSVELFESTLHAGLSGAIPGTPESLISIERGKIILRPQRHE